MADNERSERTWKPSVTVAAVIERDRRFLMIEEETSAGLVINQPAGHLEPGEALAYGAMREAYEETGYLIEPVALLGIYHYRNALNDTTYIRFAFTGNVVAHDPGRKLDTGIVRAMWWTENEIRESAVRHRTPLVMRCVTDYLAGKRHPLDLVVHYT